MSNFELWQKGCDEFHTEIYRVATASGKVEYPDLPNSGLFMTKNKYLEGANYFYTQPVYHIWVNDKWETDMDYYSACELYDKRMKEAKEGNYG